MYIYICIPVDPAVTFEELLGVWFERSSPFLGTIWIYRDCKIPPTDIVDDDNPKYIGSITPSNISSTNWGFEID